MWELVAALAFTAGVASNSEVRRQVRSLHRSLEKYRKDLELKLYKGR